VPFLGSKFNDKSKIKGWFSHLQGDELSKIANGYDGQTITLIFTQIIKTRETSLMFA